MFKEFKFFLSQPLNVKTLLITNLLGQEILTKEINGPTTIELPTGVYFVQLNGMTRKIVVE